MIRRSSVLIATALFVAGPAASYAACNATGEITRVQVFSTAVDDFLVESSTGTVAFRFSTTDPGILSAALSAQASHQRVQAFGNAAQCGVVSSGISSAGTATVLVVAP